MAQAQYNVGLGKFEVDEDDLFFDFCEEFDLDPEADSSYRQYLDDCARKAEQHDFDDHQYAYDYH